MYRRLPCFFLVLLLLGGCGRMEKPDWREGYTFTDALGREVAVDTPRRVAAMMGGFAEVWLLAGGELAAATEDAIDDRKLLNEETVANLGFYNSPGIEMLLGCEPDFVLLSSETQAHVALADTLEQAGISAVYFKVTHFEDYLQMLDICTDITSRKDLYVKNGVEVQEEIMRVLEGIPESQAPLVLLMITHSGGMAVQDSATMTGRMLAELGCINLADENPGVLADMSVEYVIEQEPDFIFVIPMGGNELLAQQHLQALVEGHPAWGGLEAVREGRYILLPKEGFLYKPNAAWGESYRYLAEVLYGGK